MTDQNAPAKGRREVRRGGRAARKAARAAAVVEAQASAPAYITRQIPFLELCSEEGLDIIEANAETILEEIGIDFKDDPDVLDIWRNAGADVDGDRVRFPKGLARILMATAPADIIRPRLRLSLAASASAAGHAEVMSIKPLAKRLVALRTEAMCTGPGWPSKRP